MKQTYRVVFDGQVLHPQGAVSLETNREYTIIVEDTEPDNQSSIVKSAPTELFDFVLENAQDLGNEDLAEQHDHYLYGTPKQ